MLLMQTDDSQIMATNNGLAVGLVLWISPNGLVIMVFGLQDRGGRVFMAGMNSVLSLAQGAGPSPALRSIDGIGICCSPSRCGARVRAPVLDVAEFGA